MKRIMFITGTRADFGKMKPLIRSVDQSPEFECLIFCTGMHLLENYGQTVNEIKKAGFEHCLNTQVNQNVNDKMEMALANTILILSKFLDENHVDLLVTHGDRVETLATATVGALRNILVAHIEGGEISGTIDDSLRHSSTKMAHIHFVCNENAAQRLRMMGEEEQRIKIIGSPDVDVMLSKDLPCLFSVREKYDISFNEFSIACLHPVTTEKGQMKKQADVFFNALLESGENFIVIHPNNDFGSDEILDVMKILEGEKRFLVFPSVQFESFLVLLKHSKMVIGNSSVGVHEAPVYGVPTIDVGSRQRNRFICESIKNIEFDKVEILNAIKSANEIRRFKSNNHYGLGNSTELFMKVLRGENFWKTSIQKRFVENV
jgi:UDP-N-acetylglucosamine 2-epimerase (hydrolysing)